MDILSGQYIVLSLSLFHIAMYYSREWKYKNQLNNFLSNEHSVACSSKNVNEIMPLSFKGFPLPMEEDPHFLP